MSNENKRSCTKIKKSWTFNSACEARAQLVNRAETPSCCFLLVNRLYSTLSLSLSLSLPLFIFPVAGLMVHLAREQTLPCRALVIPILQFQIQSHHSCLSRLQSLRFLWSAEVTKISPKRLGPSVMATLAFF